MSWLTEVVLAGSIGAAGWFLLRGGKTGLPSSSVSEHKIPEQPNIIGDRFRILNEEELIYELGLAPSIANIKLNLGLSNENWHKDALPLIHNFIRFVQRLPASESHHHAGDGGLVKHTLDVATMALLASNAKSWPPGAKTEEIARLTPVWRYGILTGALLHDIGKVLTSFDIELYATPNDKEYKLWMPDTGKMEDSGRHFYRVLFPEHKAAYDVHKTLGWTFFQIIVPVDARRWMGDSDPELIRVLRGYLSGAGDDKHPMAEIIRQADMTSTARDLRAGSRQRFATAKRTPLVEIVMETLKEMLHERGAHFSVAVTAGGDIFRKGDSVFIMAKNVPDKIRAFLENHHPDIASSFPSDNERIFDTLLEYGAVLPAQHDESKAVANIEVQFERGDGAIKTHQFSVLQFNLQTLYPEEPYPAEFMGELEVLAKPIKPSRQSQTASEPEPVLASENETAPEENSISSQVKEDAAKLVDESENVSTVLSHIPDNYEIPPPPTARKSSTEPTSIDDFLAQHNLLEIRDDETAPEESASGIDTGIVNDNTSENAATNNKHSSDEDLPKASVKDAAVSKNVPKSSKSGAKSVHSSTKSKKSIPLSEIRNLFAAKPQKDAATEKQPSESTATIPDDDSAAAGLAEIKLERDNQSVNAPRPVEISKGTDPTLDEIFSSTTPPSKSKLKVNNALEAKRAALQEDGKRFLNWLADGLGDGSISVNQNDSMVHFIERGMILVTPLVFKTYTGGFFDKNNPLCPGLRAQQGFIAVGWHERHSSSAIFHAYAEGKFLFNCLLIPEKNLRFIINLASRPANNIDLSISDKRAPAMLNKKVKS